MHVLTRSTCCEEEKWSLTERECFLQPGEGCLGADHVLCCALQSTPQHEVFEEADLLLHPEKSSM